jgi:hypothetical protein
MTGSRLTNWPSSKSHQSSLRARGLDSYDLAAAVERLEAGGFSAASPRSVSAVIRITRQRELRSVARLPFPGKSVEVQLPFLRCNPSAAV